MSIEEKCAERFDENTGGYLVCVEETKNHDATIEICSMVAGVVIILAFMYFLYRIIRPKE